MKIIRVFPRRTSMTPIDDMVFIGSPPFPSMIPQADEVHISVVFTWDKEPAMLLANAWRDWCPVVRIGGPAYGCKDDTFVPGRYIKQGITFTSRGCNFSCPYCLVPEMEGKFRQLKTIHEGNIIQDNNILLANRNHFEQVIQMLKTQKRIDFKGGLDCRLLKDWHVELLRGLKIHELWLAFDQLDRTDDFVTACL
ncbi:unnamed protein product, partial [marine sediment metagenome]